MHTAGAMPAAPEPQSARYFALLYSPEPQRRLLESLLGIEREISDSLRPGIDHHVAHSRLHWWREECERTGAGLPVHPLTRGLVEAAGGNKPTSLAGLVDVAVWDLAGATFETRRELTAYCERWAAAMMESFGSSTALRSLGVALREIELVNDLAREAHSGRIRVPLDELERLSVDPASVARPPWSDSVADLLRVRHNDLRTELARAVRGIESTQQFPLRGLLVWAALAARASKTAERSLPGQPSPRPFALSDVWFAWRMARKATMGRFTLD